jgi:hypothetical protein
MVATLPDMAKKKTTSVRIEEELARRAAIIAAALGMSTPDYLNERLRVVLEKEFVKIARGLMEEAEEERGEA